MTVSQELWSAGLSRPAGTGRFFQRPRQHATLGAAIRVRNCIMCPRAIGVFASLLALILNLITRTRSSGSEGRPASIQSANIELSEVAFRPQPACLRVLERLAEVGPVH